MSAENQVVPESKPESEYWDSVDMPGFEKDEIEVSLAETRIQVYANSKVVPTRKRCFDFSLPKLYVPGSIKVTYINGVLKISCLVSPEKTFSSTILPIE